MAKFIKTERCSFFYAVDHIVRWSVLIHSGGRYELCLHTDEYEREMDIGYYPSIEAATRAVIHAIEQPGTVGVVPYRERNEDTPSHD